MADQTRQPVTAVPTLVGRERELDVLRDALDAALAGRGSLVLIGGEAGIGKTALAEALCQEATGRGALVLVGRCYDLAETPPHGPWVEVFERGPSGGDLSAPPDLAGGRGAASQVALFAAVRAYLGALAARQPLVLLLDDLHWADPASLDLLRTLARNLADLPLLVLATYRDDEVGGDHPLAILLPALVRESRAARIDLRLLDAGAIEALIAMRYVLDRDDLVRLVAYLVARTEGNALFLGELLRTLEGEGALRHDGERWAVGNLDKVPIPALLRQVIDRRAARLDQETRRLLAVAAVIGQTVPLPLWATVADVAEEALLDHAERAIAARLLAETPEGAGVRFAHALIREAHYTGTPAIRRRGLHRRAGEALAEGAAPDPDAVAYHFQRAGDPRAAAWLIRAGERAQRAYAWLTAAERFRAAMALLEAQEDVAGERGWLLLRLAKLYRSSDTERGMRLLEEATTVAAAREDRVLAACVRFATGLIRCYQGEIRDGLAEMAAGIAALDALSAVDRVTLAERGITWLADTLPPGERDTPVGAGVRAYWLGNYVLWLGGVGRYDETLALGTAVVAESADATLADPLRFIACADAHFGLGFAHAARGRPEEARAAFRRARQRNRALGNLETVSAASNREVDHVLLPYQTDRPAEMAVLVAESERANGLALGAHGGVIRQRPQLPFLYLEGRWSEVQDLTFGGIFYRNWMGALVHARGDAARTWQVIQEPLPEGPATEPGSTIFLPALALQRLAATLALDASDLPLARAWLEAHDRWLAWSGAILGRAEGHLGWAAYHRAAGEPMQARAHAECALAHAADPRQPLALLSTHRLLGELDIHAARFADAQAHLDAALALADACRAPYERALTLLALTALRAAEGRTGEATVLLEQARAVFADLGAAPALARANALTDRLAAPPLPAPPAALPFGLSAREAEVLRLVAQGLTNAQVAERLFVTPRTVGAHLTGIYTKLDVDNRAAAIRVALDHGFA